MADFLVRNVDKAAWRALKRRANADGFTLRAIVALLIQGYTSGTITITAQGTADPACGFEDAAPILPAPALES